MPLAPPLHSRRSRRTIAPLIAYLGIAVVGCAVPTSSHAQELLPSSAAGWIGFAARPASAPALSTPAGSPYGLEIAGNGVPAVYGGWRAQLSGLAGNQFYRFRARAFPTGLASPREAITILVRWHGAFGDQVAPDYVWQFTSQSDGSLTFDRVLQSPPGTSSADVELVLQWASSGRVRFDALSFTPTAPPAARPVKIAAISYRPQGTASGLESVQRAAQFGDGVAASQHPDVMVFGELLNVIGAPGSYDAKAESIPGASTDVMSALARNYSSYVVFGMLERENQVLYNTAVLIDRSGTIVHKHRKVQLPLAELSGGIFPGDAVSVFQTDFGRVSLLICQDTAFPEPARDAAIRGAELLLVPIWGGKSTVVAARAIEHSVYVAASGYDYLSEIVDPLGTPLARVPVLNTPDVAIATIDLAHRFHEDWSGDWRDVSGKQRRTAAYTANPDTDSGGAPPPPNSPPSVTIDTPSAGATFSAPATIAIGASAFDSDGTVARVDFYAGSTLVGADTTSPFQVTWSNVPPGSYSLTARAADNAGAMTTSSAVNVTVSGGGGSLPAPWQSSDIGAVGVTGTASAANGTFTIEGGGADIWGTADAFRYVWQPVSGDVDVVARVASVENIQAWVKAGVMIREQLTPESSHALMLVSSAKGLAFQRRVATGGISTSTSGIGGTAPVWVKLERRGNTISAFSSSNGVSWTLVGSDAFAMPANVFVGLAVSSHTTADLATATFDSVSVVPAALLPAPWQSQDIGAVGIAGDARASNGTFTVRGSGADVWGTADAFQYAWHQMTGDGDVIARVASVENVAAWVKAGVMIRGDVTAGSAHAFMLVSAGKGLAFQRRVASGGLSTSTGGGAGVAPAWVKLERRGNVISAFSSADGATWTLVGSDTFTMPTTVYAGLAVSSHDNTRLAAATFDNVIVR